MTARTTTSKTSRRRDEAPGCRAAMDLGEELGAHPFELLAAGIPQIDPSTVETAGEFDREADLRLDVGRDCAQLGCRVDSLLLARAIGSDPVLGLAHR